MPFPQKQSPITGKECPAYFIHSDSPHFRDVHGRVLKLRGINLSSSAKTPVGQPLEKLEGFWESAESGDEKDISFVGRVLDIENGQADIHLARLRSWGFNCIRYLTVWEAIEHAGPGKYDEEYFMYTVAMLRKCKQYGFKVAMNPHQDLFSRFSGGDGAPYWSLVACGFNPRNFTATCASMLQCEAKEFLPMVWATNYTRLAAQTMTTLFFAGKQVAPKCIIDGKNIQDWLQDHYIGAYRALSNYIKVNASELLDECVIGWDSFNEPNHGFMGIKDLSVHCNSTPLQLGPTPTPIQGFRLGVGEAVTVDTFSFGAFGSRRDGETCIDPKGKLAWLEAKDEPNGVSSKWGWKRDPGWKLGQCLWAQHGVWDPNTGELLKPDYFEYKKEGDNFVMNHWLEFFLKWAQMVRQEHAEAILFIHPPVFEKPPSLIKDPRIGQIIKSRAVMSYHFYDGLTLVSKKWNWYNFDALGYVRGNYWSLLGAIRFGRKAVRQCMRDQLNILLNDTPSTLGNYPTVIGEIGIPYDLNDKQAYKNGDYSQQTEAMDASMNGLDGENVLDYSVWCYCPDNSHEFGDHWNGEDLAIWSPDDVVHDDGNDNKAKSLSKSKAKAESKSKPLSSSSWYFSEGTKVPNQDLDLNNGSRSLEAVCRPYPIATVGKPISFDFDIKTSEFNLQVQVSNDDVTDTGLNLATEIYVPLVHYEEGKGGGSGGGTESFLEEDDDVEDYEVQLPRLSRDSNRKRQQSSYDDTKKDYLPTPSSNTNTAVLSSSSSSSSSSSTLGQLDIQVEVSAGHWELENEQQILKWYYPIPERGSQKYYINIKRSGGSRFNTSESESFMQQRMYDPMTMIFLTTALFLVSPLLVRQF